jgi:hypothetical protein
MKAQKKIVVMLISAIILYSGINVFSKEKDFEILNVENLSNYNEDRVAYQRIDKFVDPLKDDSVEAILVIKDKKTYLMMDGFDGLVDVNKKRLELDVQNQFYRDQDIWVNKMNGKPDYVHTVYRRADLMVNANEEFVTTNFGNFYRSVRDKILKRHVERFRVLMKNRGESNFYVKRTPLPIPIYTSEEERKKIKFFTSAKAKATDETIYYCEDADGDGVTETFWVNRGDGFNWGYKSGPNIIFILNNHDKDIETIIGKLANEAIYGTVEEEKGTIQTFPKEQDINDMIEWVTPMDKFYHE